MVLTAGSFLSNRVGVGRSEHTPPGRSGGGEGEHTAGALGSLELVVGRSVVA